MIFRDLLKPENQSMFRQSLFLNLGPKYRNSWNFEFSEITSVCTSRHLLLDLYSKFKVQTFCIFRYVATSERYFTFYM